MFKNEFTTYLFINNNNYTNDEGYASFSLRDDFQDQNKLLTNLSWPFVCHH